MTIPELTNLKSGDSVVWIDETLDIPPYPRERVTIKTIEVKDHVMTIGERKFAVYTFKMVTTDGKTIEGDQYSLDFL
jgi:hypothetical protein